MNHKNITQVSEFFLHGFGVQPEVQRLLFPLFLSMYLFTLLGNGTIILLVHSDMQLFHTPMYFFLSHLALADLGLATAVVPKALQNLWSQKKTISYHGCLAQLYFYIIFGNTDSCLLAFMAYDRYVAICCPLKYSTIMSNKRCFQLVTLSWAISFFHSLIYTMLMSRVDFCDPGEIPHFLCDIYPVLDVSCSDTTVIDLLMMTEGVVEVLGQFVLVMMSYVFIFYAIIKMPSATRKRKAFSTCISHICVVVLFYATVSFVYFKPNSKLPERKDMVAAMMYTMVTPLLNPFIYTLRNNEIKAAMKRVFRKHFY
ncbi:olfactory receptor 1-like [Sphaerodactylus townsendi]|uniref:olfactory receptor 1-like n=1 Tax=Sphaerodactylus townsendi TaxID=933632 RepID=UPI002026E0C1|nr:olfactory receptor 1-like [Sphaerodactylus townsendi]